MDFQISPLPVELFQPLFGLDDGVLRERGMCRVVADARPGYPCRVSLTDAEPGDTLLLLNFEHQPAASPFRSSHAIFVKEWCEQAQLEPNEVPGQFRHRVMAARAFESSVIKPSEK